MLIRGDHLRGAGRATPRQVKVPVTHSLRVILLLVVLFGDDPVILDEDEIIVAERLWAS